MSSPRKRSKAPIAQGRKLSEPLLPLHIALAWIIDRVFPLNDDCQPVPVYSSGFVASILRIIAREVLEVGSRAASFDSLRSEIDPLLEVEAAGIRRQNDKRRSRGQNIQVEYEDAEGSTSWMSAFGDRFKDVPEGGAFLDRLEKELRDRLNYADDDEPTEVPEPIERHSPLGVFARNLLNTLRKLSFDETAHLSREIARWCGVDTAGPSNHTGMWSLDRRSGMEDSLDKRMKAMQDYQSASATGDYSDALASLRRFYDYQFPSAGRGQHQHSLLNIASFHYSTGGMRSAQAAVDEAIRVARTAGDKACLQHCLSLSQRIKIEASSKAFTASETVRIRQMPMSNPRLPEGYSPMDQLWSVKPALDLGEPVHIAFRRIHSALGKDVQTDSFTNSEDERKTAKQWKTGQKLDLAAWHATQAGLWGLLGSSTLIELHEDLALSDLSPWNDGRITVILARAQRAAERAEYDIALAILLDMSLLQGMTMSSYHRWARVVWSILERRSRMHDDNDTISYLSSLQPPPEYSSRRGPGGPNRETGHPSPIPLGETSAANPVGGRSQFADGITLIQEEVKSSLRKAQKMQECQSPSHLILPHVLSAVQLSSELGLWGLYRFGVVVLGEVLLGMEGMSEKVIREVESVWDQVLGGDDLETMARGALVLGKAHMELAMDDDSAAYEAIATAYFQKCLEASTALESRSLMMESTALLSLSSAISFTSNAIPDSAYVDEMAQKYVSMKEDGVQQMREAAILAREVGEVVKLVGVKVVQGWK